MEDIDCESNFSKPSFGKAYHKLGSVQDYCRNIKLDEVPDYHIRKTDSINGSTNFIWSIGVISILCFWLLIVLMIIRGGSIFFKDSWETEFNNSNEI